LAEVFDRFSSGRIAPVRAGAVFEKGILVERPDESGGDQQVA